VAYGAFVGMMACSDSPSTRAYMHRPIFAEGARDEFVHGVNGLKDVGPIFDLGGDGIDEGVH
jgi:hypothetical protein